MNVTAGTTLDRLPVGSSKNQSQFYSRGGKPRSHQNITLGAYANSPAIAHARGGMMDVFHRHREKARGGMISKL